PPDRPADLSHGPAASPLRAGRLAGVEDRDPVLDPGPADGADGRDHAEAEMTTMVAQAWMAAERGAPWRRALAGRRVTVVGLARSGVAACRLLRACGASVTATDAQPPERLDHRARALAAEGIRLYTGANPPEAFEDAELVVVSPGVAADHPALEAC